MEIGATMSGSATRLVETPLRTVGMGRAKLGVFVVILSRGEKVAAWVSTHSGCRKKDLGMSGVESWRL